MNRPDYFGRFFYVMSTISQILDAPPDNFSTTLSGNISSSALTIGLNSVTGLGTEGVGVIYQKDADGNPITATIEFIHWTGVSGNNLTLTDTDDRGITGSASGAQAHSTSDTFEVWVHSAYYPVGVATLDDTQTLTNKTLTSPKINENVALTSTATELNLLDGVTALVTTSSTDTLTNKRMTKRVGSTESSATPTINTDNYDMYIITAQTEAITSFTTNLSGTANNGDTLWIAITGTTAIAITWGDSFESSTVTLPTTTITTNRLDVGFVWNAVTEKWRCVAKG
jgi:hypothetical protein